MSEEERMFMRPSRPRGENHWKYRKDKRKPICWCGKVLSRYDAKNCQQHVSEEHRKKMSSARVGRFIGADHPGWKGDMVSYRGMHQWVRRELGSPKRCEYCGKNNLIGRKIHWANKSRKYRRDKKDWISLCSKCHGEYDKGKKRKTKNKKNGSKSRNTSR